METRHIYAAPEFQTMIKDIANRLNMDPKQVEELESVACYGLKAFIFDGIFDWNEYGKLLETVCRCYVLLRQNKRDRNLVFVEEHIAIKDAVEALRDFPSSIARWYEFGIRDFMEPSLEGIAYEELLEEYLGDNPKHLFLAACWTSHPEADYFVGLMCPPTSICYNRNDKLATCGIRIIDPQTAIIENLQGEKHREELPELGHWPHLLVEAMEGVISEMGIKILLFRSGENIQHYRDVLRSGTDIMLRMNGTAKSLGYRKIIDSSGQRAYVKYLDPLAKETPERIFTLPKHRPGDMAHGL